MVGPRGLPAAAGLSSSLPEGEGGGGVGVVVGDKV